MQMPTYGQQYCDYCSNYGRSLCNNTSTYISIRGWISQGRSFGCYVSRPYIVAAAELLSVCYSLAMI